MKNDTILFIHRGASWYLYYVVKQARFYHPGARISVITDAPTERLSRYADIHDLADYWEGAAKLEARYEHHSPNPVSFELFCFQRWFVLRDFLVRHGVKRAIHLDSDVLVYGDLFRDFERMRATGAVLGLVGYQGPFSMLIPDAGVIRAFCDRILRLYGGERRTLLKLYTSWTNVSKQVAVSDMHALHTFIAEKSLPTVDLGVVHDRSTYDSVVQESGGFRLRDGVKDISWVYSEPWVHRIDSGEAVRLKTIHCQGAAKSLILDFFTARDVGYWRDKAAEKASSFVRRPRLAARDLSHVLPQK